jgi:CDP-glucose 4,6-dehydratase
MINKEFWQGTKVLITGITGFKGSWLAIWLRKLGAQVYGYSLPMDTIPSCFNACGVGIHIPWTLGDIRDTTRLISTLDDVQPEVIFHLAAQPIVRRGYRDPLETFSVNAIGTASVLEAIRKVPSAKAVVIVTSDKVYQNTVYTNGHKESDRLGGDDPYSASKACAELIVDAYRASFFSKSVQIATARAGNIIGGGDWAEDRLIPDAVRAVIRQDTLLARNPRATRPWQHVIDPLGGYLLLAESLWQTQQCGGGWNFGPYGNTEMPVGGVLTAFYKKWGAGKWRAEEKHDSHMFEYQHLKLDCTVAYTQLGWYQRISFDDAIDMTVKWYKNYLDGKDMLEFTEKQIEYVDNLD